MAIEFVSCLIYSRSKGHNAVQAAAYRSASKMYDERTGQHFDYRNKDHVVHSEILLPDGADESFGDRETLWNHIEKIEKRSDSQLAKDYILALPKELSLKQNIDLAQRFAHSHFVSKGLVADLNIHNEEGNPHAHILVTTRRLIGQSFTLKARDLNPEFFQSKVVEQDYWNQRWRQFQNEFFAGENLDFAVDPNHLVTTTHRGRHHNDDRADYVDAKNEYARELEHEIALHHPEAVLNQLSQQFTIFSERDMARVLNKATKTAEEFQTAMLKLKAHPSLIALGPGDDGRERFTTRELMQVESQLQEDAFKLQKKNDHRSSHAMVAAQVEKYKLNKGQSSALNHVALGEDIALIVGKAGTGKSYLMKAANDLWKQEGYRVLGIAVAGIAAEGLESEANIQSSTIASFKYKVAKGYLRLSPRDVIVLDEAGMVDAYDLQKIVRHTREAGAKLVMVGDPNQVQPIGPGAPFRALLDKLGFVELNEIKRQRHEIDREATTLLSQGQTAMALNIYRDKGQLHLLDKKIDAKAALIQHWSQNLNLNESIILAHRNEDVKELNQLARTHLVQTGVLSKNSTEVETKNGKLVLGAGDRIVFLEKSSDLNVKNGNFATIKAIDGNRITASIMKGNQEREVTFDHRDYQNFGYGYAATIYKTQGVTVDQAFVYAGGSYWSRNLVYVALSRHRDEVHLFADRETHKNEEQLKKNLSRFSIKDSVIDFPLQYALRRGLDPETVLGKCVEAFQQAKETIKDKWLFLANYEAYQERVAESQKVEATQQRREDAVLVAKFVDLHRQIGKSWSDMKRDLTAGEEVANHKDFGENYALMVERNKLAADIYKTAEKYELAMELNGIDVSTLKPYVKAHESREHVLQYENAIKQGQTELAGQLAQQLVSDGKAHGLFMHERNLEWNQVYAVAKESRQATSFKIENGEFVLSSTLLGRIDQYIKCDAEVTQSMMRLSKMYTHGQRDQQAISDTKDHIEQNNRAKLALANEILKDKPLWEKVHAETKKLIIFEHIEAKAYREQIAKNCFEAKALQKLEATMKKEMVRHQESLTEKVQQSHSRGFRH